MVITNRIIWNEKEFVSSASITSNRLTTTSDSILSAFEATLIVSLISTELLSVCYDSLKTKAFVSRKLRVSTPLYVCRHRSNLHLHSPFEMRESQIKDDNIKWKRIETTSKVWKTSSISHRLLFMANGLPVIFFYSWTESFMLWRLRWNLYICGFAVCIKMRTNKLFYLIVLDAFDFLTVISFWHTCRARLTE